MKTIAALIAGLLLSVVTFLGGLMTGSVVVGNATQLKPQNLDTASLWTTRPVVVDNGRQAPTRVPARHQPAAERLQTVDTATTVGGATDAVTSRAVNDNAEMATANSQDMADPQNSVDTMTTSAIDAGQKTDPGQQQAHAEWCSRRYASYRVADNTYQPFSGARRPCLSPTLGSVTAENASDRDVAPQQETASTRQQPSELTDDDSQAEVQQAAYDETSDTADSEHVKSCLSRYRSYDADDNSYQPYDGGPRRQCD